MDEKCMKTELNYCSSHVHDNDLPHIEWCIGKRPGLCTIFFKTITWHLKFMLYHAVIQFFWDTLDFFYFYAKLCSGGFKFLFTRQTHSVSLKLILLVQFWPKFKHICKVFISQINILHVRLIDVYLLPM